MLSNDVLDTLADFDVAVGCATAAVCASVKASVRADADPRQNGDCSLHRRADS